MRVEDLHHEEPPTANLLSGLDPFGRGPDHGVDEQREVLLVRSCCRLCPGATMKCAGLQVSGHARLW